MYSSNVSHTSDIRVTGYINTPGISQQRLQLYKLYVSTNLYWLAMFIGYFALYLPDYSNVCVYRARGGSNPELPLSENAIRP